jgi:hypothetical protein
MLHLWGKKAEGDLSRPFKTGGGLLESLSKFRNSSPFRAVINNLALSAGQPGGVQTDAASIKEAEKPATKKDL